MTKEEAIQKEVGRDRWSDGTAHHPTSVEALRFISELDSKAYGDYFDWRIGGDGDNGETLAYQLDAFFEFKDSQGMVPAARIKQLEAEIQFLKEEIEALTHEGRQGELEQANVALATHNTQLIHTLRSVRENISNMECRQDEDCDHCLMINVIDGALEESK